MAKINVLHFDKYRRTIHNVHLTLGIKVIQVRFIDWTANKIRIKEKNKKLHGDETYLNLWNLIKLDQKKTSLKSINKQLYTIVWHLFA